MFFFLYVLLFEMGEIPTFVYEESVKLRSPINSSKDGAKLVPSEISEHALIYI